MHLNRLVLAWNGPQVVGGGVTVLHFDGTEAAAPPVASVLAAFQSFAASIPVGVSITVPNSGDRIIDTTGALDGAWNSSAGGVVNGTAATPAPAGVGACITWYTGGIVSGKKGPRKLRGRTFIVPIAGNSYDPDGTLTNGTLGVLNSLANGISNAGGFAVWHRPTSAGAANGTSYGVQSHRVRDKVAFLSSRRD